MQGFRQTWHRGARRTAYGSGLAALLVALAAGGCTAGGSAGGSPTDAKQGDPALSLPAPGKYRTLLEPCGAAPRSLLKDMLPGVASLAPDQQERALQGTPAVTYDTDRRVGCSWRADAPDASHRLSVDIERVVSYDSTVSDADRAKQVYGEKQQAAHIPDSGSASPSTSSPSSSASPPASASASATASDDGTPGAPDPADSPDSADPANPSGAASGSPSGSDSADSSDESGDPGAGGAEPDLQPRKLSGLGDAAFVDDVLTQSGSATKNRTVSVVFRTSNVIVTVTYTAQPTHPDEVPDSKELQDRAQALASELADEFDQ
ncbi:DUF3558 domain-containing protein [Streptomyces sp. NPDC047002]|uniref:DUF3558 domain-containing protein n=1 Tax=Streptomyces sp. NPDC047002 TaxID=3155475 RepID=UPI003452A883